MCKMNLLKLYGSAYALEQSVQLWLLRYSEMAQNVQNEHVEVIWL